MLFADEFLKGLFPTYSVISLFENDERLVGSLSSSQFQPLDPERLSKNFNFLQQRDQLTLTITFGDADPISFYSNSPDLDAYVQSLNNEYVHQIGETIKIDFLIIKKKDANRVTIYDLNLFQTTLEALSISQALTVFHRVLQKADYAIVEVVNLDEPFYTSSLYFCPVGFSTNHIGFDRQKSIENLRTASYFTGIDDHTLVPDDFKVLKGNLRYNPLCLFLNRLSVVLSLIYLFDITSLNENKLEFKINGYKSIKGVIDVKTIPSQGVEEYFSIYQWVYSGGNLNDKIGLARNIVSLHFDKPGEIALKGSPFQSIQSSYKVYEKQNIKQYIEIRNKISDQLLDFNNRANKIIETFASGFQKSALALVTFYFSAIAIKVLGQGQFLNVFTLDATLLAIAFLAGSLVYYFVSRWEVIQQRGRFVKSYTNLKDRYTDLLDALDIQRILNSDKEFNADLNFIDSKLKAYSRMWWIFLLILFLATLILFLTYNLSQLLDTPIWKALFNAK
ncbi:MAG: hypothetical protein EOO43_03380 [Flavobacterium sp.]|nr:MAG: hypothetical protein EOO43_03380 [Flavobacterium sp.]